MELINSIDETFKFEDKEVRIIGTYNEPWFVAKDICDILELSNTTNALRNIPEKWMTLQNVKSSYNSQNMIYVRSIHSLQRHLLSVFYNACNRINMRRIL